MMPGQACCCSGVFGIFAIGAVALGDGGPQSGFVTAMTAARVAGDFSEVSAIRDSLETLSGDRLELIESSSDVSSQLFAAWEFRRRQMKGRHFSEERLPRLHPAQTRFLGFLEGRLGRRVAHLLAARIVGTEDLLTECQQAESDSFKRMAFLGRSGLGDEVWNPADALEVDSPADIAPCVKSALIENRVDVRIVGDDYRVSRLDRSVAIRRDDPAIAGVKKDQLGLAVDLEPFGKEGAVLVVMGMVESDPVHLYCYLNCNDRKPAWAVTRQFSDFYGGLSGQGPWYSASVRVVGGVLELSGCGMHLFVSQFRLTDGAYVTLFYGDDRDWYVW